MKIALRFRIEKVLRQHNIHLWNPGISKSPNVYVGDAYFIAPQVIRELTRAFRNNK